MLLIQVKARISYWLFLMIEIRQFSEIVAVNDENNIIIVITFTKTLMEFCKKGADWVKVNMQKLELKEAEKMEDVVINSQGNQFALLTSQTLQIWVKKEKYVWLWIKQKTIKSGEKLMQLYDKGQIEACFQKGQVVNHAIVKLSDTNSNYLFNYSFCCINRNCKLFQRTMQQAKAFSVSNELELIAKQYNYLQYTVEFQSFRNPLQQIQPINFTDNICQIGFTDENEFITIGFQKILTFYFDGSNLIERNQITVSQLHNSILINKYHNLLGCYGDKFILESYKGPILIVDKKSMIYKIKKENIKFIVSQNKKIAFFEQSFYQDVQGKIKKKKKYQIIDMNNFIQGLEADQVSQFQK